MKKTAILIPLMALFLTACGLGMKVAKSPDEFRTMTGKEKYYTLETFEIRENYKKVLKRMTGYAKECLSVETTMTRGNSVLKATWTPKLDAGKRKATMTLQKKIEGGIQMGPKSPEEDGYFMAVVDLKKLKGSKTQVDFRYVSVPHHREFMQMFRDRIKAEGRGCPVTEMYI